MEVQDRATGHRRLHVGLNLVNWQPDSGGCGTYAAELIKAIHRVVEPNTRITAWLGAGAPRGLEDEDWGGETRFIRLPFRSTGSPVHVAWGLGLGGFAGCREQVDVVHGLAYASPLVAPRVATVVTIHDLTWHHHRRAVTKRARAMFRLETALCGKTADRVTVDSQYVTNDLVATRGPNRAAA